MDWWVHKGAIWRFLLRAYCAAVQIRGSTVFGIVVSTIPSLAVLTYVILGYVRTPPPERDEADMVTLVVGFLTALVIWLLVVLWIVGAAAFRRVRGLDPKIRDKGLRAADERENAKETLQCVRTQIIAFLDGYDKEIEIGADDPGETRVFTKEGLETDLPPTHKGWRAWQQRDVFSGSVRDEHLRRNKELLEYPKLYDALIASMNNLVAARNCNPQYLKRTWQDARDEAKRRAIALADYLEERL